MGLGNIMDAGALIILRTVSADSDTVAASVDASRFSRKEYQVGPVCNVETKMYAWMSPVVFLQFPASDSGTRAKSETFFLSNFEFERGGVSTSEKSRFCFSEVRCFVVFHGF